MPEHDGTRRGGVGGRRWRRFRPLPAAAVAIVCLALACAGLSGVAVAPAVAAGGIPTGSRVSVVPAPAPDVFIADTNHSRVVEVPAGGGPQDTVDSGLDDPSGVAVDATGDVFIADTGNNQVVEVPAGGGGDVPVGSGLYDPSGVAVDAAGDVFIADTGNNRVVEVPAGGGPEVPVGSGLYDPSGVAVDAAGDVFIADTGNNQVVEVPAGGGAEVPVGSGLDDPSGVAVDAAGDVFIADTLDRRVVEVPAGGGAEVPVGSGLDGPSGVAVDAAGDVFIADTLHSRVVEVPAGGGTQLTLGSVLADPKGVAVGVAAATVGLGAAVSLQATVLTSPSGGAATGSVTFVDGSTVLGTASLTAAAPDTATLSTTGLSLGAHQITVSYGGDSTDAASAPSAAITVEVVLATTGSTVSAAPPPAAPDVFVADGGANQVVELPGGAVGGGLALSSPHGVAVDATGDVFIADTGNNQVVEVPAGGGSEVIASGLANPYGVAVDAAGDVFIADSGNNRVVEVPDGGASEVIDAQLSGPLGVAVDTAGDVFIADTNNNRVMELPASGGPQVTVDSALNHPTGVAVDAAGDVFIADFNNNRVVEVPAGDRPPEVVAAVAGNPAGVAVDAAGDVFVTGFSGGQVVELPEGAPANPVTVDTGLSHPIGVAVDVPAASVALGAPVLLHATVIASPSGGAASGSVTFVDESTVLGTAALSGTAPDTAILSTSGLGLGAHHITVSYGGDTDDHPSTSSGAVTVDVVPGAATMSVVASPSYTGSGQPVTVTATVAGLPAGGPTPTGIVTFTVGAATLGTGTLNASGVAAVTTSALPAGVDAVKASYGGDGIYPASTGLVAVSVAFPGQLLIGRFRFQGTTGAGDGYVELVNNTDTAVSLSGWTLVSPTGTVTLPAATTVAAGGDYLVAESNYSLSATPDFSPAGFTVGYNAGVKLVAPGGAVADAVGFTAAPAGYRTGTGLAPVAVAGDYAWVRKYSGGLPQNTASNANDFTFVSVDAAVYSTVASQLGDPTPDNTATPAGLIVSGHMTAGPLDPAVAATTAPNLVYNTTATPPLLSLGQTLTNTTAATITALALRLTAITTLGTPGSKAILRAQPSTAATVTGPNGFTATTATVALADTAILPQGGGIGSTWIVTLPTGGLAPGASIAINLDFDVDRGGSYSYTYQPEITYNSG